MHHVHLEDKGTFHGAPAVELLSSQQEVDRYVIDFRLKYMFGSKQDGTVIFSQAISEELKKLNLKHAETLDMLLFAKQSVSLGKQGWITGKANFGPFALPVEGVNENIDESEKYLETLDAILDNLKAGYELGRKLASACCVEGDPSWASLKPIAEATLRNTLVRAGYIAYIVHAISTKHAKLLRESTVKQKALDAIHATNELAFGAAIPYVLLFLQNTPNAKYYLEYSERIVNDAITRIRDLFQKVTNTHPCYGCYTSESRRFTYLLPPLNELRIIEGINLPASLYRSVVTLASLEHRMPERVSKQQNIISLFYGGFLEGAITAAARLVLHGVKDKLYYYSKPTGIPDDRRLNEKIDSLNISSRDKWFLKAILRFKNDIDDHYLSPQDEYKLNVLGLLGAQGSDILVDESVGTGKNVSYLFLTKEAIDNPDIDITEFNPRKLEKLKKKLVQKYVNDGLVISITSMKPNAYLEFPVDSLYIYPPFVPWGTKMVLEDYSCAARSVGLSFIDSGRRMSSGNDIYRLKARRLSKLPDEISVALKETLDYL